MIGLKALSPIDWTMGKGQDLDHDQGKPWRSRDEMNTIDWAPGEGYAGWVEKRVIA